MAETICAGAPTFSDPIMLLFFDTETTGVPRNYRAPLSDLSNWPRLVQIAWLLMEENGTIVEEVEAIVRPDGFVIPSGAVAVHGISTQRALEEGRDLMEVMQQFLASVGKAERAIAHNMGFDEKIVGAECLRCGLPNRLETLPRSCTMTASTDLCQLPGPYGYKWPRLDELHRVLLGCGMGPAHNALADVRACARCFFALRQRGVMR